MLRLRVMSVSVSIQLRFVRRSTHGDEGFVMNQRGMSLIEVMVAVVILASGLLGLGALQARSVVMNQGAHYRSIATDLAADLADRIRVNRTPFFGMDGTALHADLPLPPDFSNCPQNTSSPDTAPTCSAQGTGRQSYLVSAEMAEWNSSLRAQLPGGRYTLVSTAVSTAAFYRYTLTITWLTDRDDTADASFSSYTTVIE